MQSLRTQHLHERDADEAASMERAPEAAAAAVREALIHRRAPERFAPALHRLRLLLANPLGARPPCDASLRPAAV